jgi:RNA polymerase sigma factor (sigma-70 family)
VEQVRRGNEAAFEAIFDRHHRSILSFCRHMLGSPDEAEDAVQQTFVSAYDAMRSDTRELKLKAWLYAIARNKCLSMLRARRERPTELEDVPTAGLAEAVQHRADLRDLLRDMANLPEEQRAALVLSELGDLSHADIGTVVGCDPVKVKSLVFQARSSLIEHRNARETPCAEIREQLSTARGGSLRRGPLRKHLKVCSGCSAFREDVVRQRAMVALVLPVVPSMGLKSGALAAMGIGGGGAGLALGGTVAVGAGTGAAATAGGVKLATAVVAVVAIGGGGVAVSEVARNGDPSRDAAPSVVRDAPNGAGAQQGAGSAAGLPLTSRAGEVATGGDARQGAADARALKTRHEQANGKNGKARAKQGKDAQAKGEDAKAGRTSAQDKSSGKRAGSSAGSSAGSRGSGSSAERDRAATQTEDRKAARGPRVSSELQLPLPDVDAVLPAPVKGQGRRPTAGQ